MKRHTMRMFVALFPPPDMQAAMSESVKTLSLPPHRLIDPAQVHMTLAFIGDIHTKELRAVQESVDRSASGLPAFTLTPQRLITIPTPTDGGPPRLIAVATDTPPTLIELHRRLTTRLTRPDRRHRFIPHLTLLRYTPPHSSDPIDVPVDLKMFHVEHCLLMESTLTQSGSFYTEVHRARLDG